MWGEGGGEALLLDEPCYGLVDVELAVKRIEVGWSIEMLRIVFVVEHFAFIDG
jgi:hypothetical protein